MVMVVYRNSSTDSMFIISSFSLSFPLLSCHFLITPFFFHLFTLNRPNQLGFSQPKPITNIHSPAKKKKKPRLGFFSIFLFFFFFNYYYSVTKLTRKVSLGLSCKCLIVYIYIISLLRIFGHLRHDFSFPES